MLECRSPWKWGRGSSSLWGVVAGLVPNEGPAGFKRRRFRSRHGPSGCQAGSTQAFDGSEVSEQSLLASKNLWNESVFRLVQDEALVESCFFLMKVKPRFNCMPPSG